MRSKILPFLTVLLVLVLNTLSGPSHAAQAAQAALLDNAYLTTDAVWMQEGEDQGAQYGFAVASAGDVNNDGFADAMVGAPKYEIDGQASGAVFLYTGSTSGLSTAPYRLVTTADKGSLFGYSVANAGDVNNDGWNDLLIGSPNHYHEGISGQPGAAYLYYGSSSGLQVDYEWMAVGPSRDTHLGNVVAAAGDVNNDGYDDVLIAQRGDASQSAPSMVYLYLGSGSGLESTPQRTYNLLTAYPESSGLSLSGLGDVNSDGYSDFAIGLPYFDLDEDDNTGQVQVFYGSHRDFLPSSPSWIYNGSNRSDFFGASVAGGDANNDGLQDLVVGAPGYDDYYIINAGAAYLFPGTATGLSLAPTWIAHSNRPDSGFGISAAFLGDVNGDYFNDVVIGAYKYSMANEQMGAAFVFSGQLDGFSPVAVWSGYGNQSTTEYGFSVSGAGDVNDDGLADLIVGAPTYKRDENIVMGRAFNYHGVYTIGPVFLSTYLPVIFK